MRAYHGSCHCGRVRFRIEADLAQLTRCTCSMCTKEGLLGCYVPPERFQLLDGKEELTLYQFNTKTAKHFFCRTCGIHAFRNPRFDFDLDTAGYEVKLFDGRNWEAAQEARLRAQAGKT